MSLLAQRPAASWSSALRSGPGSAAAVASGYLGLYLLAAVWARAFNIDSSVLVWFPPAGVAIAGFWFFGWRLLPVAIVAEILSSVFVFDVGEQFGATALIVNCTLIPLAYALGAELLRWSRFDPSFARFHDALSFVGVGVVAASALATIFGIAVQVARGLVEPGSAATSAAVFFVGDVVGIAGVAPTLLIIGDAVRRHVPFPLSDRVRAAPGDPVVWAGVTTRDVLIILEVLAPSAIAVILMEVGRQPLQFLYIVFVPVMVVALRHGAVGAALSTGALCAVMTVGADLQSVGTLERSDFQALMAVLTISGIVVGSVVTERWDTMERHRRLGAIIEATPDLVGTATVDGTIEYVNPIGRRMLGIESADDAEGMQVRDLFADELSRNLLQEAVGAATRDGTWTGENTIRAGDGREVPVSLVVIAHPEPDGSVRQLSTVLRDISPHRLLEDQLRRAALYDDRTRMPNRALLAEHLGQTLAEGGDEGTLTAVVLVDIDRFSIVNESLGYDIGDEVLASFASRLREHRRPQEFVARHGDDQFAVVATVRDEFDATRLAQRYLALFREPFPTSARPLVLSASAGILVAGRSIEPATGAAATGRASRTRAGADAMNALRGAEVALHRAKERGGGRVQLFDAGMDQRARDRLELEVDLRAAIDAESWDLAYQPIVDAHSECIVSCEALLRWTHPERGAISPFDVVVVAEATGLILPLGASIMARACRDGQASRALGHDIRMGVNVSGVQLAEPEFLSRVQGALDESGLAPSDLVIEVTETVLAADTAAAAKVLGGVRELGCHVAMDDFGTGYSSLGSLRELPIDILKLDRTFITDLTSSARSAATVEAVIRLADALDLMVVAEGVEHRSQFTALRDMGCHRMQGWAFAPAVPHDELNGLLTAATPWAS